MPSFNTITIVGHLGKDPELRFTGSGKPVCDFTIATNDKGKNGEDVATWFRVTTWNNTAENVAKYLKKGSTAYVQGRLSHEDWTSRDGVAKQTLTVNATDVKFLDGKPEASTATVGGRTDPYRPLATDDPIDPPF